MNKCNGIIHSNKYMQSLSEMPSIIYEIDETKWLRDNWHTIYDALKIASDMEERNVRIRHDLETNHIRKKIYNESFTD